METSKPPETGHLARRPDSSEHDPYFALYVAAAPDGDIVETLEREGRELVEALAALPPDAALAAYAPDKWTVADTVLHLADAERVFAYRALRIGRGDPTPLPGFDQEPWAATGHASSRSFAVLLDELAAVRAASLHLFRAFEPEDWSRRGEASGAPISVRALAWIVAGHEQHHRRILRERYGLAV
ncbi:MAG: DinB family protein [Holophagales bacterium]|nr:DinB family protein [Myxococcales bacterium]MCB9377246.1 DinB family protein [Holophagales bacterium]